VVNGFFLDQEDDENHIVMLGAYEVDGAGLGSSLMTLSVVVMLHFLTLLSMQLNIVIKIVVSRSCDRAS
jgi:hypothetical protein